MTINWTSSRSLDLQAIVFKYPDGRIAATVDTTHEDGIGEEATNLIAAAPDLLAACEKAKDALEYETRVWGMGEHPAVVVILAAIKKARGDACA